MRAGKEITFDSKTHTYWKGSIRLPSVTQVLGYVQDTSWYTKEGAERGTWIHERCYELQRQGFQLFQDANNEWHVWMEGNFPEEYADVMAYGKFLTDRNLWGEEAVIEAPLTSNFIFAGTPDIRYDALKIIIDIKSGQYNTKIEKMYEMQLIAYGVMAEEETKKMGWELLNVYLKNGKYRAIPFAKGNGRKEKLRKFLAYRETFVTALENGAISICSACGAINHAGYGYNCRACGADLKK